MHKLLKTILKYIIITVGLDNTAKQWVIQAENSQDVKKSKGCELKQH